jgi:hypothetical protein
MRTRSVFVVSALSLSFAPSLLAAKLQDDTLAAWELYRERTEARIEEELSSSRGFLVLDFFDDAERSKARSAMRSGVFITKLKTLNVEGGDVKIPDGLVHHWYGAVFVPGAKLADVVAWEQDYDRHEEYFDEVEESRLVSRNGDVFDIFLRLRRKKVITVHYNTEHEVAYRTLGPDRVASRSTATRIAELEDVRTNREREKPVGDDRGYLWRLNSYWRFKQEEGGVVVECESVSLSRTIPTAFRWVVKPFINSVPKESLEATLLPLRRSFARAGGGSQSVDFDGVETESEVAYVGGAGDLVRGAEGLRLEREDRVGRLGAAADLGGDR